jgi:hypothetical protein
MRLNCGVLVFIVSTINEHKMRFNGKLPISIWISEPTMKDLEDELRPHLRYKIQNLVSENNVRLFDVPIHKTSADVPYMRNCLNQMEVL